MIRRTAQMKKTSNKMSSYKIKMATLIACLALICTAAVATTVAYIITETESKENIMTPSKVACEVSEIFDGDVKTDVKIKNTGDTSAYIRAAVVVTWVSNDSKVSAITPVAGIDYEIVFAENEKWTLGGDGYWYYADAVNAGELTQTFITSCSPVEGRTPDGFVLSVEIVASAVQSSPAQAVKEAWGVDVNNGALIAPLASPANP